MTRRQYVPLLAVLLVWMAWQAGWVVIAAVAAALVSWAVIRLLDGGIDLGDVNDRLRRDRSSEHRAGARH